MLGAVLRSFGRPWLQQSLQCREPISAVASMETSASAVVIPSQVEVHLQLVPDREDVERQRAGPLEATFVTRPGSPDAAGIDHGGGQPGTEERTGKRRQMEPGRKYRQTGRGRATMRKHGKKMLVASADLDRRFYSYFPHWAWAWASAETRRLRSPGSRGSTVLSSRLFVSSPC